MKERVYSIDVLRGLMAISVMIYHYMSWLQGGLDATSIWSRFGLYAVTIFYFVSGFSMMFVYWDANSFYLKKYVYRRFFRIAPLFYIMSILFLSYHLLTLGQLDFYKLFLNFTFLFSLFEPSAYFTTGAWSIGNEMFFYCVLAFVLAYRNKFKMLVFITCISLLVMLYFRTLYIDIEKPLSSQWDIYISPLNHLFTFMLGCFSYFFYKNYYTLIIKYRLLFAALGLLMFVLPISGDRVNLVIGINGLVLLLSSYFIFLLFISLNEYQIFKSRWATFLGDISYSIYLVHPACWFVIKRFFFVPSTYLEMFVFWTIAVSFTLIVCSLTYLFIEKPCISFGKKVFNYYEEAK